MLYRIEEDSFINPAAVTSVCLAFDEFSDNYKVVIGLGTDEITIARNLPETEARRLLEDYANVINSLQEAKS